METAANLTLHLRTGRRPTNPSPQAAPSATKQPLDRVSHTFGGRDETPPGSKLPTGDWRRATRDSRLSRRRQYL